MRLHCWTCKKSVSTDLPEDAVFRATAECPECLERRTAEGTIGTATLRLLLVLAQVAIEHDKGYMTKVARTALNNAIDEGQTVHRRETD